MQPQGCTKTLQCNHLGIKNWKQKERYYWGRAWQHSKEEECFAICSERCDCDIGIFDLENIDVNSHYVTALMVENLIGGKQKFDELRKLMRNVKKFTMTSLRASLSDVLPTEVTISYLKWDRKSHLNFECWGRFGGIWGVIASQRNAKTGF